MWGVVKDEGVDIIDVIAKTLGLYLIPELRYALFCCLPLLDNICFAAFIALGTQTPVPQPSPPFCI